MKPTSVPIALLALAAAGCTPHYVQYARPAAPAQVDAPQAPPDQAWSAALHALATAQVPVASEDPGSGTIETQQQETFTRFSLSSPPTRKLHFRITVQPGHLDVLPLPEICESDDACRPTDDLTEVEATLADRLVTSLRGAIAQAAPPSTGEPVPSVALQAGHEVTPPQPPPAPSQPAQPVLIRTRGAGLQEVDPGKEVEIDLVDGHRLTGRVLEATPEWIRVDAGTGPDGIVVHAYDVDRLIAQ